MKELNTLGSGIAGDAYTSISQPIPFADGKGTIERLRKPVSFIAAFALVCLLIFTQPRGSDKFLMECVKLGGFLLVFAGALGRILCTLYIGGRKNRELCQSGVYQMCRNPLYFFSFVALVGICLAAENIAVAAIAATTFLSFYRAVILSEEKKLLRLFPETYPPYQNAVPRFWPRAIPLRDSQDLRINTAVFIRSLLEVWWFLAALAAVEALGFLQSHGYINSFSW